MKVCIVGAGIVGCAAAYALARAGHEVVVLDEATSPARGASFANGAQLSYSYVQPLAGPATLRGLPSLLLDPRSPLVFRPRMDPRQWSWGVRFLAACTAGQSRRGTRALLELAQLSRQALDDWVQREGWEFSFAQSGKLVLCPDVATLSAQREQVAYQAGLGCRQSVLTADQCVAREPALAACTLPFVGGVWTEDEGVADPRLLAEAMLGSALRLGGSFRGQARVTGWRTEGRRVAAARVVSAQAGLDEVPADAFVLCAGVAAAPLMRQLGGSLPVYPIKGYSLTLRMRPQVPAPRASITDLGLKTVFAPLAGRLRVAAMAEIVGYETDIPPDRVQRMLDGAEAMFPGLIDRTVDPSPWAGLRPATPTSVPIVGPSPRWENFWLNAGHGALGLTLAAGCAHRVAAALTARAGA